MTGGVLVTGGLSPLGRRLPPDWTRTARTPDAGAFRLDVTHESDWRLLDRIRPQVLVHLAAQRHPVDLGSALAVNTAPLVHLLEAAERVGVERVVLVSSAAVYGDLATRALREDAALSGTSAYALSKIRAEELVLEAAVAGRVPSAVVLRPFNLFGPGMEESLVNRLARSTQDDAVELLGWEGFVRDYIHVDDVAEAIVRAVERPLGSPAVINLGRGEPVSNRDLVDRLAARRQNWYRRTADAISMSWADVTLARELLGFTAARELESVYV